MIVPFDYYDFCLLCEAMDLSLYPVGSVLWADKIPFVDEKKKRLQPKVKGRPVIVVGHDVKDKKYGLEGSGNLNAVAVSSLKDKDGNRQKLKDFDVDVSRFKGSAIHKDSRAVGRLIFNLDDEKQFEYYEKLPADLTYAVVSSYEQAMGAGYHTYPSKYTGGKSVKELPCKKPARPAKAEKEMERRREKARKYLKAHGQKPLF